MGRHGWFKLVHDGQVHKLLYQIRQCDDTHQALEPLAYHDMIAELGNQGFMYENYDALIVEYNKLEKKAKQLLMVMQGAADTVKPVGVTVSKPLTKGGVANVVAWFEMDDGHAKFAVDRNSITLNEVKLSADGKPYIAQLQAEKFSPKIVEVTLPDTQAKLDTLFQNPNLADLITIPKLSFAAKTADGSTFLMMTCWQY